MARKKKVVSRRPRNKILADINRLVTTPGYIFVIAELVSEDFFVDVKNVASIEWRERLHNNEFALLVGLLLKPKIINFEEISSDRIKASIQRTRALLNELHWTFGYNFSQAVTRQNNNASDAEKERNLRHIWVKRRNC